MRNLFSPRLETLEARRLLSRGHIVVAHHRVKAATSTPIALDGTLTVNNQAATLTDNADGSSTSTTPVSGRLGALGKVRGVWTESTDEFGESTGFDTIRLRNAKGSVVLVFSAQNTGRPISTGQGAVSYNRAQQISDVPGAYAHVSEKGMIALTTNRAKTSIVSMVVTTQD